MGYLDLVKKAFAREKSVICLGADPDPDRMPTQDALTFLVEVLADREQG